MRCRVCGAAAEIYIPYARMALCGNHFSEYLVSRVKSTVERYGMVRSNDTVLVAVSGGKDSLTLLHVLSNLASDLGIKLVCFHIDLGIGDYSRNSREVVKALSSGLGLELITVELRGELGESLPNVVKLTRRPACAVCGVLKRYLTNKYAVELGVSKVATGHVLDDIAKYILASILVGNYSQLTKLTPTTPTVGKLISRIKPLYEVYERETALYTLINKIPATNTQCPLTPKPEEVFTDYIGKLLKDIETRYPGTMLNLVRGVNKNIIKQQKTPEEKHTYCQQCGMPTTKNTCTYCRIKEKIKKMAGGMVAGGGFEPPTSGSTT